MPGGRDRRARRQDQGRRPHRVLLPPRRAGDRTDRGFCREGLFAVRAYIHAGSGICHHDDVPRQIQAPAHRLRAREGAKAVSPDSERGGQDPVPLRGAKDRGYLVAVTADHGNIETLYTKEGKPHVAHSTNLVPFIVLDPQGREVKLHDGRLGDVAPTVTASAAASRWTAMGTTRRSGNPMNPWSWAKGRDTDNMFPQNKRRCRLF